MISKTAVMVIAGALVAASPAFAQQYPTAHQTHVRDYGIYNYGPAPSASLDDPALTGGGSIGYNSHLTQKY
jgi:hypothetical protein